MGESKLDSLQLLLGIDGLIHSFLSLVWCGFLSYETSRSVSFHFAGVLCLDTPSSVVLNVLKLRGNVLATDWLKGPGEGALSILGDLRPVVEESYEGTGLAGT